ncbi:spondin-1 [Schistocerca gregaria]|uniref:spondin-1 n=1 Tax=Schistocerca gregaria TaxID=7010 RepID=UPI00211EACD5|nr:spondin-1 [Schistocerca gregaria]
MALRRWSWPLPLLVLALLCGSSRGFRCTREPRPEHSAVLKSPGDNGFRITVTGEPEMYVPGSVYTLSLVGSRTHGRLQMFTRFMLTVEPKDPRADASPRRVGSFQLFGDSLTTFNDQCVNTISEADDLPKTEVQVMWNAPPKGSGCVIFRAMVFEDPNNWYADDGSLSRQLCELPSQDESKKEDDDFECCACDEAKYKMVFEGIWSNKTHPKDFPFSLWLTHFSDVIGATHERNFSFWGEGQIATDGLMQVAEWGSVRGMEAELRAKSKHLRTLIKAAGLWYPRVNSNTSANFRVDRRHPLVSLVSMLGPTPDWIVGVSGLNLCKKDCTWMEEKIVDLFPYDAGTDSGITYMSPNTPTIPREKIHRITTMYPEDPRAPFYDPSGREMAPLARLYLFRDTVIAKSCDEQDVEAALADLAIEETENTEDTTRPECAVTEYSPWSECSVTCGKGIRMRQRSYLNAPKAEMLGCDRQLVSKEMCVASAPSCPGGLEEDGFFVEDNGAVCGTTEWGPWSECSVSCGIGFTMRTRKFLDRMGRKKCPHVSLVEKDKCMLPECTGPPPPPEVTDPMCPVTAWNEWSPCSASCGKGVKLRTRLLLVQPELQEKCSTRVELVQQLHCVELPDCTFDMATAKQVCMMEPEPGVCRGYFQRWYFDARKGMCIKFIYGGCRGNRNNFLTEKECQDSCNVILGGAPVQPPAQFSALQQDAQQNQENTIQGAPVNCRLSAWSPWSRCSVSCGYGFQTRQRRILTQSQNGGRRCPTRLVRRKRCFAGVCPVPDS